MAIKRKAATKRRSTSKSTKKAAPKRKAATRKAAPKRKAATRKAAPKRKAAVRRR